MAHATVAVDLHQPLDIQVELATQVALNGELAVHDLAQAGDLIFAEVARAPIGGDRRAGEDLVGRRRPDAVDVRQRHPDLLFARNVDAGDACHSYSITPAFVCALDWNR